jgi:uncharacterized metal-binding protein
MNVETDILRKARQEYEKPNVKKMAFNAALVESTGYMKWTRVEDTMEFARGMHFKKVGIACCVGLMQEGRILVDILIQWLRSNVCILQNWRRPQRRVGIERG